MSCQSSSLLEDAFARFEAVLARFEADLARFDEVLAWFGADLARFEAIPARFGAVFARFEPTFARFETPPITSNPCYGKFLAHAKNPPITKAVFSRPKIISKNLSLIVLWMITQVSLLCWM